MHTRFESERSVQVMNLLASRADDDRFGNELRDLGPCGLNRCLWITSKYAFPLGRACLCDFTYLCEQQLSQHLPTHQGQAGMRAASGMTNLATIVEASACLQASGSATKHRRHALSQNAHPLLLYPPDNVGHPLMTSGHWSCSDDHHCTQHWQYLTDRHGGLDLHDKPCRLAKSLYVPELTAKMPVGDVSLRHHLLLTLVM
jgi:hypothetical protein